MPGSIFRRKYKSVSHFKHVLHFIEYVFSLEKGLSDGMPNIDLGYCLSVVYKYKFVSSFIISELVHAFY